jgi:hypothetical protein
LSSVITGDESLIYGYDPEAKQQSSQWKMKSKAKNMRIILFGIKGIVHKELILAGQTVNSAYCCHVLWKLCENVRRLRPELWRQNNWLLHHDNALPHISFCSRVFLTTNNMAVVRHRPYFSMFP